MASTALIACSALAVRTTGTIPTSVMNARISLAVMNLTVTRYRKARNLLFRAALNSRANVLVTRPRMSEIDQLDRILKSAPLVTSPSLSRFLRYIVEETLAGRTRAIREYTLGV